MLTSLVDELIGKLEDRATMFNAQSASELKKGNISKSVIYKEMADWISGLIEEFHN